MRKVMKNNRILTPRELMHIGLSVLGSIIMVLLIVLSGIVIIKKMPYLIIPSTEELHKMGKRLILQLGEKPLSKQKEASIQNLTQEIEKLANQRLRLPR